MNVFSVVFQDFKLLSYTLGANVAVSEKYDGARVKKCLTEAGFGDRLETLDDGLDTYLYKDFTKKGVTVSGGEAQKIARRSSSSTSRQPRLTQLRKPRYIRSSAK